MIRMERKVKAKVGWAGKMTKLVTTLAARPHKVTASI